MAKKTAKYLLITLLVVPVALIVLSVVLSVMLYMPAIQRFAKDKAIDYAFDNFNLQLSIEHIRLRFPIDLTVDNATVAALDGDTLFRAGELRSRVALRPLLKKKILVNRFTLKQALVCYKDTTLQFALVADVKKLALRIDKADLVGEILRIPSLELSGGKINLSMHLSDSASTDTTSIKWKIIADKLKLSDVDFGMEMYPRETRISAQLKNGMLKKGVVDLGKQTVRVESVELVEGVYSYLYDSIAVVANNPVKDTVAAPWTVEINQIRLKQNQATYGILQGSSGKGLDMNYMQVSGLNLSLDSVYNKGIEVKTVVNNVSLTERSGLRINSLGGRFEMNGAGVALTGLRLETLRSRVQADIRAGDGILQMQPSTPVMLRLSAGVSFSDLFLLYPSLADDSLKSVLESKTIEIESNFFGSLDRLNIAELQLSMPGSFTISANGSLESLLHPEQLEGDIRLDAQLSDLSHFVSLIPDTALRSRIALPDSMRFRSRFEAREGVYSGRAMLRVGEGRLRFRGDFNPQTENYSLQLYADSFPVYRFLPSDSLGLLTAQLRAIGQGFDPYSDTTRTTASLHVERIDYGGYDFGGLSIDINLLNNRLLGELKSQNEALQFDFGLTGSIRRRRVAAAIKGEVGKIDLNRMQLTSKRISTSFMLNASASLRSDNTMLFNADVSDMELALDWKKYKLSPVSTEFSGSSDKVRAALRSGDLSFDFEAPVSLDSLITGFDLGMAKISKQIIDIGLNVEELQHLFPPFTVDASAGKNNILSNLLRINDVWFNQLTLASSLSREKPFRLRMEANGLSTGSITIDTFLVGMRQANEKLEYYFRLANKPGNLDSVALVYFYGNVIGNKLEINCRQRHRDGHEGIRFGANVSLFDNKVTVNFFPENPIFGFENWAVNKENYLVYRFSNKNLYADINMHNNHRHIIVQSSPMPGHERGAVRFDVAGINIATLLALFPATPPVEGIFGANLLLGVKEEAVDMEGKFTILNLLYDNRRVGDIELGTLYRYDEDQTLNLNLSIDQKEVLTAGGNYGQGRRSGRKRVNITVDIPSFPLSIANAFFSPDLGQFSGDLKGKMTLRSNLERTRINGALQLSETSFNVPIIGTNFRITDDTIVIRDNIVLFNNYSIIAPNKKPLQINGIVDITDFSRITTNMSMKATDFQVINVPKNKKTMVHGKASMNLDVSVKGPLDELAVRGDTRLLNGTEAVYVLRESDIDIKDEQQQIVNFVSFKKIEEDDDFRYDSIPALKIGGMDVLVNVGIDSEVKMSVNLSEDGKNRIDLRGGGNLTYSVNQLGDSRFAGRYMLVGGTVRYKPPVIAEKSFAIQDGSYVEWNGNIDNPTFSITAVEDTKSVVQTGNGSRSVNFKVQIIIKNTLENLAITMDLSAPEDIEIQNQIASLTAEQRATQAMNLLIYDTYTPPGEANKVNIDNPLNAFVSQQLNRWARNNLKNVDLSFGISTYDKMEEGVGTTRTDYSYKLSKSLFDDRFRVSIGGRVSSDTDPAENLRDNLIDDIALEYRIGKRENMFLKLFRHTGYESILEGEVTQTGGGFLARKKVLKLRDLFKMTWYKKKTSVAEPVSVPIPSPPPERVRYRETTPPEKNVNE